MGKSLVAYFSATGATKRLAEKIADTVDADLFAIEPVKKYTNEDLKWPSRDNRSCMEMKNKSFRPRVLNKLDSTEEYDRVFIGFPVWYDAAPSIVNSFIEENDLDGKKAYVFVTSGITSVDRSFKNLKELYPNISFISGKRFNGSFYKREVYSWLNESEN